MHKYSEEFQITTYMLMEEERIVLVHQRQGIKRHIRKLSNERTVVAIVGKAIVSSGYAGMCIFDLSVFYRYIWVSAEGIGDFLRNMVSELQSSSEASVAVSFLLCLPLTHLPPSRENIQMLLPRSERTFFTYRIRRTIFSPLQHAGLQCSGCGILVVVPPLVVFLFCNNHSF